MTGTTVFKNRHVTLVLLFTTSIHLTSVYYISSGDSHVELPYSRELTTYYFKSLSTQLATEEHCVNFLRSHGKRRRIEYDMKRRRGGVVLCPSYIL